MADWPVLPLLAIPVRTRYPASIGQFIRFLDLQHFLFLRSQGFEDRPTVAFGVDEEIPTKLRYHRGPR